MRGAIPPLSHTSTWCGDELSTGYVFMAWYIVKAQEQLYLYLYLYAAGNVSCSTVPSISVKLYCCAIWTMQPVTEF
jgi:hypothetical protein